MKTSLGLAYRPSNLGWKKMFSLVVQWLGLSIFTAGTIRFWVGEIRSLKPPGQKTKTNEQESGCLDKRLWAHGLNFSWSILLYFPWCCPEVFIGNLLLNYKMRARVQEKIISYGRENKSWLHVYMDTYTLFQILFHYRLLQDILLHSRFSFIYFINSHVYLLSPNT